MDDDQTVLKEISDRGIVGRFAKALFILVNLMLAVMLFGAIGREVSGASSMLGKFAGVIGLVALWGFANLILGAFVLITRRKRLVRTEDFLTFKRQENTFRKAESLKGWSMALIAWILYTALAGAWIASLTGVVFAIAIGWLAYSDQAIARFPQLRPSLRSDDSAPPRPVDPVAPTHPTRPTFGRRLTPPPEGDGTE